MCWHSWGQAENIWRHSQQIDRISNLSHAS